MGKKDIRLAWNMRLGPDDPQAMVLFDKCQAINTRYGDSTVLNQNLVWLVLSLSAIGISNQDEIHLRYRVIPV